MELSRPLSALGTGAAGALAVTALHESARRLSRKAPRMDAYGRRGLAKVYRWFGKVPPFGRRLQRQALVGELLSNSLYYGLLALFPGKRPVARGAALGALAGLGGLYLPQRMNLGRWPSQAFPARKVMTVAWYAFGGLVAGAACRALLQRA
jgi:hypothetical protein